MTYSGAALRAEREARKITILALSRHSGVHRNTLWRWEGMAEVKAPKAKKYLSAVRELATEGGVDGR